MVNRIPHQVYQWIAQFVDHSLVQLRFFTADQQRDFLATLLGQVAHNALEAMKKRADRHHPRVQHSPLKAVRDAGKLVDGFGDLAEAIATVIPDRRLFIHQFHSRAQLLRQRGLIADIAGGTLQLFDRPAQSVAEFADAIEHARLPQGRTDLPRNLDEASPIHDQFARQVHQGIQAVGIDAHRLGDFRGAFFRCGRLGGLLLSRCFGLRFAGRDGRWYGRRLPVGARFHRQRAVASSRPRNRGQCRSAGRQSTR